MSTDEKIAVDGQGDAQDEVRELVEVLERRVGPNLDQMLQQDGRRRLVR